jgi:uncharacterized membrane protein
LQSDIQTGPTGHVGLSIGGSLPYVVNGVPRTRSWEDFTMTPNVHTWERALSIGAGAALLYAAVRQPRLRRWTAPAGASLIARGLSGFCPVNYATGRTRLRDDTRRALGGPRGIHVHERLTIERPLEEVYEFWRDFANLAKFMHHVERVDVIDRRRSHWVVRGPAGRTVEWDAEIINEIEPELIAWRSLPDADVASAGSVQFRATPRGGTEVRVRLQYQPPAGKVGSWLAALFGREPSQQIHEDLRRLKQILEAREARTMGNQPAERRNVTFPTL